MTYSFYRLVFFFLIFLTTVYAEDFNSTIDQPSSVASMEGLPSSLINNSVCAITGDYVDCEVDAALAGPEPLIIQRSYSSLNPSGNFGNYWTISYRDRLKLGEGMDCGVNMCHLVLMQACHGRFLYKAKTPQEGEKPPFLSFDLDIPKGLTNGAGHEISGRTNVKNQRVKYLTKQKLCEVTSGAGHKYIFSPTEKDDRIYAQAAFCKVNGNGVTCDYYPTPKCDLLIQARNMTSKNVYSFVSFGKQVPHDKKHFSLFLTTSEGKKICYSFMKHAYTLGFDDPRPGFNTYLERVEREDRPSIQYEYKPKNNSDYLHISTKKWPDHRYLHTDYYVKGKNVVDKVNTISIKHATDWRIDRVKTQSAPVGIDKKPIITHRFVYYSDDEDSSDNAEQVSKGHTEVFDAYLHKSVYFYDEDHRLFKIEKYAGLSDYTLHHVQRYVWGKKGTSNEGNLLGKFLRDATGYIHAARYFDYDDKGNIICRRLYGHLTGHQTPAIELDRNRQPIANGVECDYTLYTYSQDGLNLLTSEVASNGKITFYEYWTGTDLLKAKYIGDKTRLYIREFYYYDGNKVLCKKIVDDGLGKEENDLSGVSERHITYIFPRLQAPVGLPERVDEMYLDVKTGQEVLIKRVFTNYSIEGRPIKQDFYDSQGVYRYSLYWEYDAHGNTVKEINALGEMIERHYDQNHNLIEEIKPRLRISYTYDFSNRLIEQDEVGDDGHRFAAKHQYDYLGNRVMTIDSYGNATHYAYDDFGHVISTMGPSVPNEKGELIHPQTKTEYDIAGHPVCQINAKNEKTVTRYNSRGKPVHILYPDGSQELFLYETNGNLFQKVDKNGVVTRYTYDVLGRVTQETTLNVYQQPLKVKTFTYSSFHLLSSTDAEGLITHYAYDGAGRLIATAMAERVFGQSYDTLGRVALVIERYGKELNEQRVCHKVYDVLGRLLEERMEESNGTLVHLTRNAYDSCGNCIRKQEGESVTYTQYNSYGKPVNITDALGNTTHIEYNHTFKNLYGQFVLQTITTDPMGYNTIETYDTAGRLSNIATTTPFGVITSCQDIFYDALGNKAHVVDHIYLNGKELRQSKHMWYYNESNQVTIAIEAMGTLEQKMTRHVYNALGQKAVTVKPDGTHLFYQYDVLGRLSSYYSSDGSFSYVYEYNLKDLPIRIADLKNNCINERHYDLLGQLIIEKLGNGLVLQYTYDQVGRAIAVTLPDQSSISYTYQAVDLKEVRRIKQGQCQYLRLNRFHNLSGAITEALLPGECGTLSCQYDLLNRCIAIKSPLLQETIPKEGYDKAGNLLSYEQDGKVYTFAYDDLYHLAAEKSHTEHSYVCDSACNRILKDGQIGIYNALNQLIQQGDEFFSYDPSGNMIQRRKGNKIIEYSYDALDRLIAVKHQGKVTTYTYDSFNRRMAKKQDGQPDQYFLYQGQDEVGTVENGSLKELKILGTGQHSKTVAIELQGTPYVPIQDLFGHIIGIADLKGHVIERYRYTAFGEEQLFDDAGTPLEDSLVGNPWRYASKRKDQESGLIAFSLRYYSPDLGRWITADPIGYEDGPNLYAYVHHSPMIYFDALGLFAEGFFNCMYNVISGIGSYIPRIPVTYWQIEDSFHKTVDEHLDSWDSDDLIPPPYISHPSGRYELNQFIDPKTNSYFDVENIKNKGISFINGIMNAFDYFAGSLMYLGSLAGVNIQGVYSATTGPLYDGLFYILAKTFYCAFDPVGYLHSQWDDFFKNADSRATFLQTCHSRGAVYVRDALMSYDPELRKRIEVLAIAPGAYIDPKLCHSVHHYVSKADVVPWLDAHRRLNPDIAKTVTVLNPHKSVSFLTRLLHMDHSFNSPTYAEAIQRHIELYLAKQCG